jgi:hypothetical protein
MGTIAVSVDGDPIFNWQGDEAAITQLMEAFPSAAEHVGLTPNKFAQACVSHLSSDMRTSKVPLAKKCKRWVWFGLSLIRTPTTLNIPAKFATMRQ